jgi:hypothetical protein
LEYLRWSDAIAVQGYQKSPEIDHASETLSQGETALIAQKITRVLDDIVDNATPEGLGAENNDNRPIHMEDNFFSPANRKFYHGRPKPYKRLNQRKKEIRLLLLNDRNCNQSKVEVKLCDKVPLSDVQSQYYAISYAAGSHKETEEISVDGRNFNAFLTLATGLRRIRDQLLPTTSEGLDYAIWADQICINQSNPRERAHQVEHMRQIYEGAAKTIIILGNDRQGGRGMRLLQRIWDRIKDNSVPNMGDDSITTHNQAAEWVVEHVGNPKHREDWTAACEVFGALWWRRGWVCQEAIVSKNAMVLYGDSEMHIKAFVLTFDIIVRAHDHIVMRILAKFCTTLESDPDARLDDNQQELLHSLEDTDRVKFILTNVGLWNESPVQDMKSLLRHSRLCETTDERDKVYAFVGLADPAYGMKPNYEVPLVNVYTDAAARIILTEGCLDILFDANEKMRKPYLPSWVPDWSSTSTRESMLRSMSEDSSVQFRVSSYYSVKAQVSFPEASANGYGRILRIEAFSLGKLSIEAAFGPADGGDSREKAKSWMQKADFDECRAPAKEYVAGGTVEEAFINTVFLFNPRFEDKINLEHIRGSLPETQAAYETFSSRESDLEKVLEDWCFFINQHGYMGVSPSDAKYDDYLCIAWGAPVPFILRKCGERYKFIGEAYVHGLMHGEAIEMIEAGQLKSQYIDLI